MDPRRLAIGTAQFGLSYGIANGSGQIAADAVAPILQEARAAGVDTLDTAAAYGDAEARLGAAGVDRFRVISKLPPYQSSDGDAAAWVERSIRASLTRLGIARLDGLLLHRSQDVLDRGGEAIVTAMRRCQELGLTAAIGASVYTPADLDALTGRLPLGLVQLPCSVVDRRFIHSGWIARLCDAGTEVHVRSVFLQGLLLMPPGSRPPAFDRWEPLWRRWDAWLDHSRQGALDACLGFIATVPGVARVVVGIDGLPHLRQILAAIQGTALRAPDDLSSDDRDLVEPVRWTR